MLLRLYIVLLTVAIGFVSCYPCNEKLMDHRSFVPTMYWYFGVWQPDNWWVYKNQTGLLTDSVYITDFIERRDDVTGDFCYDYPLRSFTVNSQHFKAGDSTIGNVSYYSNGSGCLDFFRFFVGATINCETDLYPRSLSDFPETFYETFEMNNHVYQNVLFLEGNLGYKAYFAPHVGMIRYINLSNDTFSLTNYYVK